MRNFTDEQIIKAAKIMKIIRLSGIPGMDVVAVKLNSEPTWEEQKSARMWAKAFSASATGDLLSAWANAEMINGGPLT